MEPLELSLLEVLGIILAIVVTASALFLALIWGKPRRGKLWTAEGEKPIAWQSRNDGRPRRASR